MLFATLMLITYVEPLSLWLPSQFMDQSAEPELEELHEEQSIEDLQLEFGNEGESPTEDPTDNEGKLGTDSKSESGELEGDDGELGGSNDPPEDDGEL